MLKALVMDLFVLSWWFCFECVRMLDVAEATLEVLAWVDRLELWVLDDTPSIGMVLDEE